MVIIEKLEQRLPHTAFVTGIDQEETCRTRVIWGRPGA